MQPPEVLATYIFIQCKRNQNRRGLNGDIDPAFIQQAQQTYTELKTLINKICDKLRIE